MAKISMGVRVIERPQSEIEGALGGQSEQRSGAGLFYFATVIVLQILFGVLATLIVMA